MRAVRPCLLACALVLPFCAPVVLAAADAATAPKPVANAAPGSFSGILHYVNSAHDINLGKVGDLSQVALVRFYQSADHGATWTVASEIAVTPGTTIPPHYHFKPDRDGTYFIVTCSNFRNGTADPLPVNGQIPPNALGIVYDTTAPVLAAIDGKLVSATADHAVVQVTWTWTDAGMAKDGATIDASGDGGVTFPVNAAGQAEDSLQITVPLSKGVRDVVITASAKDLAGNHAIAPPLKVMLPEPVDPVQNLVKAVTALPPVDELQVIAPALPPKATTPAGTGATAGAPGTASATATPAAAVPVATASADPNKPDVVVSSDTSTDGAVIAGSSIEDAYQIEVAKASGLHQAPTRPGDVETTPPPAAPVPDDSDDGSHPYIPNPAAGDLLNQANAKAAAGDRIGAVTIYRRLRDSSVADAAVAAELGLLWSTGANQAILDTADGLPPELSSDTVRLYRGRALVALGKQDEAITALKSVRAGAPEAREALFLIGKCFKNQGKTTQATRIFTHLAQGNDDIAKQAQAQL